MLETIINSLNEKHITEDKDQYDIIFDIIGKISYTKIRSLLIPGGKYISVVTSGHTNSGSKDLITLTEPADLGKLKPVIDMKYSF